MSNILSKIKSDVINPFETKNKTDVKIVNTDTIMSPTIQQETQTASDLLSNKFNKYIKSSNDIFMEYKNDELPDNKSISSMTDDEFVDMCIKYLSDKPNYLDLIIKIANEITKSKSK